MSLNKQIQKLIDAHTADVVRQLAEKYGSGTPFTAEEAMASLVDPAVRRRANAPPRPANAFMRFSKEQRPVLKAEYAEKGEDLPPKDVLRELGRRWGLLSDEEKQPYQEAYREAKAEAAQSS